MNALANYYVDKYGLPERRAKFVSPDGKAVEIFKWNSEQSHEGVTMYATLGACKTLGSDDRACEFFIGIMPAADDIAQALAEVALHGNGSGEIPSSGDTVTLAYPLWSGTDARSFLFTAGEEIIPPIKARNKTVEFLQLVPLFDSELQYKKDHGEGALWRIFEENEVPFWDSRRQGFFDTRG